MLKFILLLFCITATAMPDWRAMEEEIEKLPEEKVGSYWVALGKSDQDNLGNNTYSELLTIVNLYKTAVMVHYHGYPTVQKYDYPAYVTPWSVWVHCQSVRMKAYTFPMILEGKDLGQLPNDRYPNYFVGGYLLDAYGLDMEFDPGFNEGGNIIAATQKLFEEGKHEINIPELRRLAEEWISDIELIKEPGISLGKWIFPQHESKNYFSIVDMKDKGLYLLTRHESGLIIPHRLMLVKDKEFEAIDGLGLFHLKINQKGQLMIISTKTGKAVKVSEGQ